MLLSYLSYPGLSSALDKMNILSRKALFVLGELVATSLEYDINFINISRSSIHRSRRCLRSTMTSHLKYTFSTSVHLTVHRDGKLMEDLICKKHVDRLPILISSVGMEQLLGVPKLASGRGETQAAASFLA